MALVRSDPFREIDRVVQQAFGGPGERSWGNPMRPWGDFTRQVLLGSNLDVGRIRAEYDAGVLTVSIPVAEHAKPRRIDVNVREGSAPVASPRQPEPVST